MSEADVSLMELFREEVRSHAAVLTQGLLELENDPGNSRRIEPLMRAAHSIKGAARIVNIDDAVQLAHLVEDVLVAAQEGRIRVAPADVDLLLRATDVLARLGQLREEETAAWSAASAAERAGLVERLRGMAGGQPAPAGPAMAPGATPDKPQEIAPPAECARPADDARPVEPARAPGKPTAELLPAPVSPPRPDEQRNAAASDGAAAAEAVVRVSAQNLNRLMGLAGESLVQARWLDPFATALLKLKKHQDHLAAVLENLGQALAAGPPEHLGTLVAEAKRQSSVCREVLAQRVREFQDHSARAEDLNGRLYREAIASRMRPFADGTGGFPRLVRDMARRLDKPVRLQIDGQSTEVDRDILERLEAPLTHLLRNAVDHGIEPPDRRRAAGKPETGLVTLEARHRAGTLEITVADDGAGIDLEKLRARVVERGLATAELARVMTEPELLEFLFLPGFSTAGALTEYSGRGVGLDVVQTMIRQVGGSVRISTRPGKGTRFHLHLPVTLSVVRAVLVDIGGEPYAFPHNRIDRLLRVSRSSVRSLERRQFVIVDGQNVGLVLAAQLLDLPAPASAGDELPVLLLSDPTGLYGLIVDAFRGEQDLVVRPLDPRLGKVPNISAAAVLDDGSPVLIADVEDLVRSMDQFIQRNALRRTGRHEEPAGPRKRVLVVDDSVTVRQVESQLLRNHGYDVAVAVDGKDAWNVVRSERFDLVVSDVDMPRMNGLELVEAMRADPALRNLPVIIVSYKEREEDRLRGLQAGANCYLTKGSFHDHTFLQAVTDLIGET